MKKHDLDNRSRQLNPQDPRYYEARDLPVPPLPAPAPEAPPAPGGAKKP